MKIRIAELNVEILDPSPLCVTLCRDFLHAFERADITVTVSEADIMAEMEASPEKVSFEEAEFACIYRAIAQKLPDFDAFVFHASVVECDGRAFAFSAPSGTGKSTHTALWLECYPSRARILNGDKPIFRFLDGRLLAFGTPWCGKERQYTNASAPLEAICFLERAAQNSIQAISGAQIVRKLYHQILMPNSDSRTEKFLCLLDRMVESTPVYLLRCNMHPAAAEIAYRGMRKENI